MPPNASTRARDRRADGIADGDVGRHRDRLAALCREPRRQRLGLLARAVDDRDIGAALGEELGDRRADPHRPAGDERGLAGEFPVEVGHQCPPTPRLRPRMK